MARRPLRNLKRRSYRQPPLRRILVFCEGEVTEPSYLQALKMAAHSSLVVVEIDRRGGPPRDLVKRAVERKRASEAAARRSEDEFLRYDEVWCVFDVDDHAHLPDARQQARDHGVELAVSNPCFELWALLHFQEQAAHIKRGKVGERLRKYLPDCGKELPFEKLQPSYELAVERARRLDQLCEKNGVPGDNPSTGVHRLTETIREGGKEEHLRKIQRERD